MQRTKLCRLTVVAALVAAVLFFACPKTALAETTDTPYNVSYFSNAHNSNAPDATLREINDGAFIGGTANGDLCANIYVFDATEELKECCSCRLTPNHLLTLSVNQDLTNNAVTGGNVPRGVIKILTTPAPAPPAMCDPTTGAPTPGLEGWLTHIQKNIVGASTTYSVTEEELASSTLSAGELADLEEDCMVGIELGSGQGVCATHVATSIGGEFATDYCRDAGR